MEKNECRISLASQFMRTQAKDYLEQVKQELALGKKNILIDAAGLDFVDSTGVGALVQSLRLVQQQGGDLVISGLRGEPLEFFHSTSLDRLFQLQDGDQVRKASEALFGNAVDIKLSIQMESRYDACVVRLSGVMNPPDGTRYFKEQMLLAMAEHRQFILDMTSLTYLDSMSISALVNLACILKSSDGKLRACCANTLIAELFKSLNMEELIPSYSTLDQALAAI
jgi:anti-sigma B factor antagonist